MEKDLVYEDNGRTINFDRLDFELCEAEAWEMHAEDNDSIELWTLCGDPEPDSTIH